jgi:hypothetical protein
MNIDRYRPDVVGLRAIAIVPVVLRSIIEVWREAAPSTMMLGH